MSSRSLLAALVMAALSLASAATGAAADDPALASGFRGGPRHLGVYPPVPSSGHGIVEWAFETDGPVRGSPLIIDDMVLVGSASGDFCAADAASGEERWRFHADSPISSSAAASGDLVFFGDRANRFYALDRRSGALRWRAETGADRPFEWGSEGWDYYTSSPVVAGDRVIVGSGDGCVYAFDVASGDRRWRYETAGRVRSSPAADDDRAYVGSADGGLYAIDIDTGRLAWRFETWGAGQRSADFGFDRKTIQSSPVLAGNMVVFGSRDGKVYAVDAETGAERWRYDNGNPWVITSPAFADGTIYVGSSDGQFVQALDAASGEEVWRLPTGARVFSSPAVSGDRLHAGHHGGRFLAIDRASGEVAWQLPLGAAILSSPVAADGRLYVGADDGCLYAIGITDGPAPRLAVYWDEARTTWNTQASHESVRDYLEQRCYEVIDRAGLTALMQEQIDGAGQSVVVFAMDDLPDSVAPAPSDTVLVRRYLEAGGRVVWLGLPPMLIIRDDEGKVTGFDKSRPESLLGVSHERYTTDRVVAMPTPEGRRWGLEGWWIANTGVECADVVPLAVDENGMASAWIKSYGGPPGSGWVQLWGSHRPIDPKYYSQIAAVAETGITCFVRSEGSAGEEK